MKLAPVAQMIHLQIAETGQLANGYLPVDSALLKRAAQQVLSYTSSGPDVELGVVLSDDAQLRDLNRQFLGIDTPTDVLAFPVGETDPDSESLYLGDVIISYPRALAQAQESGHPVEAELQLLIVHGVLHLLGYDHANPTDKTAMWAAQVEILERLGCSLAKPPL